VTHKAILAVALTHTRPPGNAALTSLRVTTSEVIVFHREVYFDFADRLLAVDTLGFPSAPGVY
jgi:hypothetical protein